jgi:hypothetical protein
MNKLLHRSAGILAALAILAGTAAWSGATPAYASATTPPPAPPSVSVTPSTTTDGTVLVTWTAPDATDLAYYELFRYNGTQAPTNTYANPVTYIGKTVGTENYFVDQIPTEGTFRYAVVAVDTSGNAGIASSWVTATVDMPANGAGVIQPDGTAPATAANVRVAAAYSKVRTVALTWNANAEADLWRYLVYRQDGTAAAKMQGYVAKGTQVFNDILTADGIYTYYVVAQDETGNISANSAAAVSTIDNAAPVVQVTSPVAGSTFPNTASFTIAATITDAPAGYEATGIKYYLDGALLASPTVTLSQVATGPHTVKVEATDRAGNRGEAQVQFIVGSTTTDPAAPRSLTAPVFTKSRTVALSWQAPLTGTALQYLIYRSATGGTPELAGTTLQGVVTFTDSVLADGLFAYYVVAVGPTGGLSPASNTVATVVDTVAPAISVTAPQNGKDYDQTGTLAVQYSISDSASGNDPAQVKLFLDSVAFTGSSIDLAALTVGSHTFKVEAADRAGNKATRTVQFSVGTPGTPPDDGDQNPPAADLITLLQSLQPQIHHGHYTALMAKLRAGNIRGFTMQVIRDRGKFITNLAADKLLEAAGAKGLNIDPNTIPDDEDQAWSTPGKGKGHK